jgi:hypothetical protein
MYSTYLYRYARTKRQSLDQVSILEAGRSRVIHEITLLSEPMKGLIHQRRLVVVQTFIARDPNVHLFSTFALHSATVSNHDEISIACARRRAVLRSQRRLYVRLSNGMRSIRSCTDPRVGVRRGGMIRPARRPGGACVRECVRANICAARQVQTS